MDGGAWWATVHGVAESQTRLSDFTLTFHFPALEKEMAIHSSVLAWRIQGWGSLVGCCLLGHTESDTTERLHFHFSLSCIGEGNGNPLQYSCLENPMDGGAWWATVHEVAKSQTRLSDFTFTFQFHALEKEMATHSSVLAWRIQGQGSLAGFCLWGRIETDTTEAT